MIERCWPGGRGALFGASYLGGVFVMTPGRVRRFQKSHGPFVKDTWTSSCMEKLCVAFFGWWPGGGAGCAT